MLSVLAQTSVAPPNLSALWVVVLVGLNALTSLAVGYLLLSIRGRNKAVDDRLEAHARQIEHLGEQVSQNAQTSLLHDGRIRELMVREFVPRAECRAVHAEVRDTNVRIFNALGELQKAESATARTCEMILKRVEN